MGKFDYSVYRKIDEQLGAFYKSIGIDAEKLWDIHEKLQKVYSDLQENTVKDVDADRAVIEAFVDHCSIIKNAFYYPIYVQECLQLLILIASYPIVESESQEMIMEAAYDAVHIYHTTLNHAGE